MENIALDSGYLLAAIVALMGLSATLAGFIFTRMDGRVTALEKEAKRDVKTTQCKDHRDTIEKVHTQFREDVRDGIKELKKDVTTDVGKIERSVTAFHGRLDAFFKQIKRGKP